jgi:hypothetical protein
VTNCWLLVVRDSVVNMSGVGEDGYLCMTYEQSERVTPDAVLTQPLEWLVSHAHSTKRITRMRGFECFSFKYTLL